MNYLYKKDCFAKHFLEQICVFVFRIYFLYLIIEFEVVSSLRNEILFLGHLEISPNGLLTQLNVDLFPMPQGT